MDVPDPEEIINLEGPPGESLFRRFVSWCLPSEASKAFQHKIDAGIMAHVSELDDDRLLVLVGALVIENAIDELLALVPDFRTRGRSLIQRFAYLDEHVEMLLEGMRKAGLTMVD